MDGGTDEQMDKWMDEQMDRCEVGWWMDKWVDG